MRAERVVVGATRDDLRARVAARRLRDEGHEIVFIGASQSIEQLGRTAVAEDAALVVADADAADLVRLREMLARLDAADIRVEPVV